MSLPLVAVSHNHVAVVERLSRYSRTLKEGIHCLVPCVDSVHYVNWSYANASYNQNFYGWCIPLSDQCYDPDPVAVSTSDGVQVEVDLVVYFTITDPVKAVYGTPNLFRGIENLLETALAAAVRSIECDKLTATKIDDGMRNSDVNFEEKLGKWGVHMKTVRVQHIELPQAIRDATTNLVASKRSALVNITKLEEEFDRKTKLAKHDEIERKSRYLLEQMENKHRREEERKEQDAISAKTHSEADANAYATIKRAQSEAEARRIRADNDREITRREIEMLEKTPAHVLQYLTLRSRYASISEMNKSASNTLIVGPEQTLADAAKVPVFNVGLHHGNRNAEKQTVPVSHTT